jgi:hypothetical protein
MEHTPEEIKQALLCKLEPIPKNLHHLVRLIKTLEEHPNQASYHYAVLLDISEPTFYRNVKYLRQFGVLHSRRYKVVDDFYSTTPTQPVVVQEPTMFQKLIASLGNSTSAYEDFAIAVANGQVVLTENERANLKNKMNSGCIPNQDITKALRLIALLHTVNTDDASCYKERPPLFQDPPTYQTMMYLLDDWNEE